MCVADFTAPFESRSNRLFPGVRTGIAPASAFRRSRSTSPAERVSTDTPNFVANRAAAVALSAASDTLVIAD
jgi:hypothetical protein